ncbi:MAG: alpha,alpha-trehalose-phosphate synthase (UDP-forming) [Chromatiales bacterium]
MNTPESSQKLIIVSNRLPFVVTRTEEGRRVVKPAAGGLVTALLPVLRDHGGVWVGWTGTADGETCCGDALADAARDIGFQLVPVGLSEDEVQKFYMGFSNEIIWPLFHDLPSFCNFEPSYWQSYLQVSRKFARVVSDQADDADFVWVHDYHLINVANELRRLGRRLPTAFFLHIPFPPLDLFLMLPWRQALLRSLLDYDLIGFQTLRDRRNFITCLRTLLRDVSVGGKGQVLNVRVGDRRIGVGHFPIGIDCGEFARSAASEEVRQRAAELHDYLPNRQLILGVDRLDYTKGILLRLTAFREALVRHPDLHNCVTLIQVVVPSREHIRMYFDLRQHIEQMVSRINGEFTQPGGWVPIHYVFRSLEPLDLLAYYRAAEIGLVTPLKDGMNLVAKEYCTCSIEEDCVLILSEFAGAAAQLRGGALLVNPFDVEGVAEAIYRAYRMDPEERRRRMRRMRHEIQRRDVFWWVESFLKATRQWENRGPQPHQRSTPAAPAFSRADTSAAR